MQENQPDRHQRRRIQTRKKLQDAAINLLLEKGYDNITVQNITDGADLGRGTFYLHFKDKEEIIWSVIEEGILEADQQAHRNVQESGMPERPLFEGIRNMFAHAEVNRALYLATLSSHGSLVLINRVSDLLAADLLKEMRIPSFDPRYGIPHEVTSQIVTGAIIRSVVWWLENDNPYDKDEMAEMLYAVLNRPVSNEHLIQRAAAEGFIYPRD